MLLGGDSLAASARYSHKVAYRAIMPIADGIAALGDDKANNQCAHLGPDAHIVTFPVSLRIFSSSCLSTFALIPSELC